MRGTFVYDIITAVGMVLMVFLVIYWSVQYGTDMVANMLLSDPAVIQGTLASGLSFSCRPYNYTFEYKSETNVPGFIALSERMINIIPPAKKFRDWTSVERGGFVQYRSISPSAIIDCGAVFRAVGPAVFEKSPSTKFSINKKANSVDFEVK